MSADAESQLNTRRTELLYIYAQGPYTQMTRTHAALTRVSTGFTSNPHDHLMEGVRHYRPHVTEEETEAEQSCRGGSG